MTWTTTKPTRVGWYWYRASGGSLIVYVYQALEELYCDFPDDSPFPVADLPHEWAGPIPEPTDKEVEK